MLGLSATRQQASTTVDCAQKHSSCTICRDKLHCNDKIIPPAGSCPSYSGPAAGATHSAIRTHRLQRVQRSAGNQQGSLGNSKRFISTFVAGILLIVLVNMDQLVVIWLQNEHTQKTLSPHLLLTSPVKRRSQRNASVLPTFAIASIPSSSSIRKPRVSSSRQLI